MYILQIRRPCTLPSRVGVASGINYNLYIKYKRYCNPGVNKILIYRYEIPRRLLMCYESRHKSAKLRVWSVSAFMFPFKPVGPLRLGSRGEYNYKPQARVIIRAHAALRRGE